MAADLEAEARIIVMRIEYAKDACQGFLQDVSVYLQVTIEERKADNLPRIASSIKSG